jgi:hypothetical protein
MPQQQTEGWFSRSGVLEMSWRRDSMALHADSNLSRPRLTYMDWSGSMELFHTSARDVLALDPEIATRGFRFPP